MPNIVSLIKALFQRNAHLSEDDKEIVQRMIDQSNAVQTQEGSYEQAEQNNQPNYHRSFLDVLLYFGIGVVGSLTK